MTTDILVKKKKIMDRNSYYSFVAQPPPHLLSRHNWVPEMTRQEGPVVSRREVAAVRVGEHEGEGGIHTDCNVGQENWFSCIEHADRNGGLVFTANHKGRSAE